MRSIFAFTLVSIVRCGRGFDGWRPGAHPFVLREEEKRVEKDAVRHETCAFLVVDAAVSDFQQVFESHADEPLLIKNLMTGWSAFEKWTPTWFKGFVRDVEQISPSGDHQMAIIPWNVSDPENPMCGNCSWTSKWSHSKMWQTENYFKTWNFKDEATGAFMEPNALVFDPGFQCDDPLLEPDAPMPRVFRSFCNNRHMAFNAFGTGHGFHRHNAAWQAQVIGNKSWYLMPPKIGHYVWDAQSSSSHFGFPHEEQSRLTNTMCGYQPVRQHYRENLHFCVQGPGEVVYVPDFWWHSTCALDEFNIATGGQLTGHIFKNLVTEYRGGRLSAYPGALDGLTPARRHRAADRGTMRNMRGPLDLLDSVEKRLKPFGAHAGTDLVFEAIDGYCWEEQWMFILGDVKGAIVENVVSEWVRGQASRPMRCVEFGSFVGYSAMRVAKHLPQGSDMICIEPDYASPDLKHVVDTLLSRAYLHDVVKFEAIDNYKAIEAFAYSRSVFDIVITDHIKDDYLPTLKRMTESNLLRPGTLFIADNVIVFGIVDLLRHLRFSGDFQDYRLYYTELEYDDHHGQPAPNGNFWPDGVVFATYVGPGKGAVFDSPTSDVCGDFKGCAACLANLCAWCSGRGICVPDALAGKNACGATDILFGLFEGDLRCRGSELGPKEWVGPVDATGLLRRGHVSIRPDFETCSEDDWEAQRLIALS